MALIDVDVQVDRHVVVVGPVNPSAEVTVQVVSANVAIAGAVGIRGPKGDAGKDGAEVVISEFPPSNPKPGTLWFDSANGVRYLWYVDIDGGQWVNDSGPSGPAGPEGPNTIGGAGISITNLKVDDTLIYTGQTWTNTPKTALVDGGNF